MELVYNYDTTALGSNYAVNEQDFRWVIIHEFERHGWQVIDVYLGNVHSMYKNQCTKMSFHVLFCPRVSPLTRV